MSSSLLSVLGYWRLEKYLARRSCRLFFSPLFICLILVCGSAAAAGTTPLTADQIDLLDASTLNALDRTATDNWSPAAATTSDILAYSAMAAPLSLVFTSEGSNQAGKLGLAYLETQLLSNSIIYALKRITGRTRPFVYSDNPKIAFSEKSSKFAQRSFPSGHTAEAFSSLVFLAMVHQQLYPDSSANSWIWGSCLVTASVTGYMRYAAGYHFPTDIFAGALIGAFAGWLVPHLHDFEPKEQDPAAAQKTMMFGLGVGF